MFSKVGVTELSLFFVVVTGEFIPALKLNFIYGSTRWN